MIIADKNSGARKINRRKIERELKLGVGKLKAAKIHCGKKKELAQLYGVVFLIEEFSEN